MMKKKCISLLFVLLAAIIYSVELSAQTKSLNILFKTEESRSVALNTLSKITFSSVDMILKYTDEYTENVAKKEVKNLSFGVVTGVNTLSLSEKAAFVHPNPATDCIVVENIPEGENRIRIYSVTGGLIRSIQTEFPAQTIDISTLNKGLYLLKLNNQILKFTKL